MQSKLRFYDDSRFISWTISPVSEVREKRERERIDVRSSISSSQEKELSNFSHEEVFPTDGHDRLLFRRFPTRPSVIHRARFYGNTRSKRARSPVVLRYIKTSVSSRRDPPVRRSTKTRRERMDIRLPSLLEVTTIARSLAHPIPVGSLSNRTSELDKSFARDRKSEQRREEVAGGGGEGGIGSDCTR